MKISLTLHGVVAKDVLRDMAQRYAMLSIKRVVTVRHAPKIEAIDEARWRDMRETLLSLAHHNGYPFVDLPEVGEPEWPERYDLVRDFTTVGARVMEIPGIGRGLVGGKQVLRKGAKKKPTYIRERAQIHANEWADAFWALVSGAKTEEVS